MGIPLKDAVVLPHMMEKGKINNKRPEIWKPKKAVKKTS
jgi:hypothetical protein